MSFYLAFPASLLRMVRLPCNPFDLPILMDDSWGINTDRNFIVLTIFSKRDLSKKHKNKCLVDCG